MIITIDGPVGTGKSTIAKKLAEQLGFLFFDTGAMYRCLTYGVIKNGIDHDNIEQLNEYVNTFKFEVKIKDGSKHYYVENEEVTDKIRQPETTGLVSKISAIKSVREKLVNIQRRFAQNTNAVFEGRDMGTVVFPDAELKIFLTGRDEVRAQRRFKEMRAKFPNETKNLTIEELLEDIRQRDEYDSNRTISPLRPASDAHIIDTSDLTVDEIIQAIQLLMKQ